MVPGRHDRLDSIQVMRAVAAMLVVAYHLSSMTDRTGPLSAGIDIFFFVSGFIMVHITEGRRPSFGEFMRARAFRIVPLYWIATIALIPIWWLRSEPLPRIDDVVLSLLFIFHTDHQSNLPMPVLGAGWTTNYIMFFYLVFGATLSFTRTKQIAILGALFLLLTGLRPFVDHGNAFAYRMTSPILFEFLFGCIAAAVLPWLRTLRLYSRWMCLLLVVLAVPLEILTTHYLRGLPRAMIVGGPAAMFMLGVIGLEDIFSARIFAPLRFFGDTSYSLYLFHLHAILIFGWVAPAMPDALFRVLAFSAAVLYSAVSYLYVETPVNTALRRSGKRLLVNA